MGGGARVLVRQLKTAVFLRKSPKPGGSKSVKTDHSSLKICYELPSLFLILFINFMLFYGKPR